MPLLAKVGERLLPSLVDEIATTDPDRVLYSVPKTKDLKDGFQDISAKTFARAVDRCSWHLHDNLGRDDNFSTLMYMGPQDLVYGILVLACIKTGYKLLLSSPRNTLEGHLSLLEQTDCYNFLLPAQFPLPVVKQVLAARQMRVLEISSLQHWLEAGALVQAYPYMKTFAEAKSDPFVVLHTSGSTGMPKHIVQTHGTLAPLDAFTALPSLGMKPTYPAMCKGMRVYVAFPLFHCAGLSMLLPGSIYSGFTVVLGPFPPSADVVNSIHVHADVQHSCLAPMTLVDLVKVPSHLENLSRLKQVTFGGGPCPQAVGDLVSSKTRLLNCLGTTECGVLPVQLCEPRDWSYLSVSPVLGHVYHHVSEDLYEQVIKRDSRLEMYQGIFHTFPNLEEWHMKDLYSKHPSEDNTWLYRGRTDDIIVFTTGEKLNPLEMESIICANPAVRVALITGLGRFQASLLVEAVEPPRNDVERLGLLEALWPSVEAANKQSPSHGSIHRNMILFTTSDKPMLRAGKGTVQRKMTVDLYKAELDSLYERNRETSTDAASGAPVWRDGSLGDKVKQIISESTNIPAGQVSAEADLFELGLDSLQVALIAKQLSMLLLERGISQRFSVRMVYANPTISKISTKLSAFMEGRAPQEESESDAERMQNLYNLYAANMPQPEGPATPRRTGGLVVLLTGSTGSLGSYILDSLMRNSDVSRVYCLNRGHESLKRQERSQLSKGLGHLNSKVKCLDANLSQPWRQYRYRLGRRPCAGASLESTT